MTHNAQAMYGAFDLKRYYQRNMLIGTFTALFLAMILMALVRVYGTSPPEGHETSSGRGGKIGPDSLVIVWKTRPRPGPAAPGLGARLRLPKPTDHGAIIIIDDFSDDADDSLFSPEDTPYYGFEDPSGNPGYSEGPPGNDGIVQGPPGYLPPVDTFIVCEVQPEFVHNEIPVYPRIAREGGFTAEVLIQAFIGPEGKVIKAQAARCSRPGMGFEEAAVEAAYKCTYRPAIQNGQPVGIWISYTVKFVLD